jgi:hypothetical protein
MFIHTSGLTFQAVAIQEKLILLGLSTDQKW